MAWGIVAGAVAAPLVGGLIGSQKSGNEQQQTQKQELDPRMQALLYGNGGTDNGLLNDANDLRKRQFGQGGLNDMQRSGMEMQRQTLMSPQYTQGFDQMRNVGSSLMSAGVSGNPFNNGGNGHIGGGLSFGGANTEMGRLQMSSPGQQMQPMQPFQYQQNQAMQGGSSPFSAPPPPQQAAPPPQQASSPLDEYLRKMMSQQDYQRDIAGNGGSS